MAHQFLKFEHTLGPSFIFFMLFPVAELLGFEVPDFVLVAIAIFVSAWLVVMLAARYVAGSKEDR